MFLAQPPARRFLPNQVELSNNIRKGWVDTARWLRGLIISNTWNLVNRDAIEMRLRQTADEAATLYSQYYGPEVGNRVRDIYLDYFQHVKEMIRAYLNRDATAIYQQRDAMHDSASELAMILAKANRYWDEPTFKTLFDVLVDDTETQITNLIAGDYIKDIQAYDEYLDQAYRIADEQTYGILQQFQI